MPPTTKEIETLVADICKETSLFDLCDGTKPVHAGFYSSKTHKVPKSPTTIGKLIIHYRYYEVGVPTLPRRDVTGQLDAVWQADTQAVEALISEEDVAALQAKYDARTRRSVFWYTAVGFLAGALVVWALGSTRKSAAATSVAAVCRSLNK
jgi:hypothetical protein